MKSTKTSILFRPWVGAEYEKGIGGKRLLVLGESHYSDTADPELTQIVMKKLLDYKLGKEEHASWMNTFTVFERSVANRRLSGEESCAFWNSVLFCNFLQEVTTEAPRQALAVNDLQRSADAFFKLLEEHRPEYIIAWGGRLWDKLLPAERWQWGEEIVVDSLPATRFGYYTLADGTRVKAIPVRHPSAGYSWPKWHLMIADFMV